VLRSRLIDAEGPMALSGAELLAAFERWQLLPRAELVRRCGFVSVTDGGQERLNYTAFYEALLEATGVHLGDGSTKAGGARGQRLGRSGRILAYYTKVQFNGNLMVGRAYLDLLQAKPGDRYLIQLGRNAIRLQPIDGQHDGENPTSVA